MKKKIFKSIIACMLTIVFTFSINGSIKVQAAENTLTIKKVVFEHDNVREGDTQTIDISSKCSGKIQYRVWLNNKKNNKWIEATNGFSNEVGQNEVFVITTPNLEEGEYNVSVWARRVGSKPKDKRGFDTFSLVTMKCLKSNGDIKKIKIDNIKQNYSKGQTLQCKRPVDKNYSYKFSVYNAFNNKVIVPYQNRYNDSFSWKAYKNGLYLLKVRVKNTEKVEIPNDKSKIVEEKVNEENNRKENNKEDKKSNHKQIKDKEEVSEDLIQKDLQKENIEKKQSVDSSDKESIKKDENVQQELEKNDSENDLENANTEKKEESKDFDKEETKDNKDKLEDAKKDDVQYKEVVTEEVITKLILVGNPYEEISKPRPKPNNSIYVANVSETSRLYIRSKADTKSKTVGYIYGCLSSVNIIKTVGSYYYIEATDYGTLRRVRGYVPCRYIKAVQPRRDYSITVDLSDQYIYVYKNGKMLKKIVCSTGLASTPTPIGTYIIGSRGSYFLTGVNKSIKCYNWVRFNNNFLFHSVLCTMNGRPLQSAVSQLGKKASHGCIRLPMNDSKWFYNNIPAGTVVTIRP